MGNCNVHHTRADCLNPTLGWSQWKSMAIEKPPYKTFMFSLLGMVLSTGLLMASLWQIEIASALPGDYFDFPFYLWRVSKWWARDFWYTINIISWILAVLSTASLVTQHNTGTNKSYLQPTLESDERRS